MLPLYNRWQRFYNHKHASIKFQRQVWEIRLGLDSWWNIDRAYVVAANAEVIEC